MSHPALAVPELLESILALLPASDLVSSTPAVSQLWLAASRSVRARRAATVLHCVLVLADRWSAAAADSSGARWVRDATVVEAAEIGARMCAEAAGVPVTERWMSAQDAALRHAQDRHSPPSSPPTSPTTPRTFQLIPLLLHHTDLHLLDASIPLLHFAPPTATPIHTHPFIADTCLEALVVLNAIPSTPSPAYRLTIRFVGAAPPHNRHPPPPQPLGFAALFPGWPAARPPPPPAPAYFGNLREGYFGSDFAALFRVECVGATYAQVVEGGEVPSAPRKMGLKVLGLHVTEGWLVGGVGAGKRTPHGEVYSRRKWRALEERCGRRGVDLAVPGVGCRTMYYVRKHLFCEDPEGAYLVQAVKFVANVWVDKLAAYLEHDFRNKIKQTDILAAMRFEPSVRAALLAKVRRQACARLLEIPLGMEYLRRSGYEGDLGQFERVFAHLVGVEGGVRGPGRAGAERLAELMSVESLRRLVMGSV
ncbi:hypothetical protein HDU96_010160 [Phlyctochytrium bullatum]|nr:hypothetical protein HDU96_010160 [Phlyctochytrium bullatum]